MTHKLTLLNTRPEPQNTKLSHLLRQSADITVIQYPTIDIAYFTPNEIEQQIPDTPIDYFIFTSVNAIPKDRAMLMSLLGKKVAIAVGKKTAATLKKLGWLQVLSPEQASSEGLAAMSELQQIKGQHIVIFTGKNDRPYLSTSLEKKGAIVNKVYCYQRVLPDKSIDNQITFQQLSNIDIVLITSITGFDNLKKQLGKNFQLLQQTSQWLVFSDRIKEYLMPEVPEHAIIVCEPHDKAVLNVIKSRYQR